MHNNTNVAGLDGKTPLVEGVKLQEPTSRAESAGQIAGHAISVGQGVWEMGAGAGAAGGSATAGLATSPSGVGLLAGAAGTAGGLVISAHGMSTALNGLNNMLNSDGKVYKVPGEDTESGKPYIGRSKQKSPSKRGKSDGRDRSNAEIIDEYDSKNPGEGAYKEQRAIDREGGIDNLDNKRNEVRPDSKRAKDLDKKYGSGN